MMTNLTQPQILLILPMLILVLYTSLFYVYMGRSRKEAVVKGHIQKDYFRLYNQGGLPERLLLLDRHLANLFEAPLLFYITTLACLMAGLTDAFFVITAWFYLLLRIIHAAIHLTTNNILKRFRAFVLSLFIQLLMIAGLLLSLINDLVTPLISGS